MSRASGDTRSQQRIDGRRVETGGATYWEGRETKGEATEKKGGREPQKEVGTKDPEAEGIATKGEGREGGKEEGETTQEEKEEIVEAIEHQEARPAPARRLDGSSDAALPTTLHNKSQ